MEARFRARIGEKDEKGCMLWTMSKDKNGYGQVAVAGKVLKTHRLAYELVNGAIPTGMCVRHKCDNPPCCNPEHLEVGTHAENMRDKKERGRQIGMIGETNGRAKMTDEQVRMIRSSTLTNRELSILLNISYKMIWDVRKGISWGHLV